MGEVYYLTRQKLESLLGRAVDPDLVYIAARQGEKAHFQRYRPGQPFEWALGDIRPVEPLKQFFMKFKEAVARPGGSFDKKLSGQVIVGVKACDLRAVEVYDKVFLEGEVTDPFYRERREHTVLISADCPNPEDSCFCNLVGIQPYPVNGFDLNLSIVDNGYLIEVGSEKGAALVKKVRTIFQPASSEQLKQRDDGRARSVQKLKEINPTEFSAELPKQVAGRADAEFWAKEATTCVECCACLHICPTCYCFLLYDRPDAGESERIRIWDACYYAAYARVGGGANPRPDFSQRFKNRFLCKYSYFPGYHEGLFACSGCGRCISGCTAKIDIREVLWRV